ncbi:MAG: hypothetical protein ACR2NF_02590 [Pirellulales bacterium]
MNCVLFAFMDWLMTGVCIAVIFIWAHFNDDKPEAKQIPLGVIVVVTIFCSMFAYGVLQMAFGPPSTYNGPTYDVEENLMRPL